MGMSNSANFGKKRRRRCGRNGRRGRALSEINITPLVDVMLVLLIVFMVAAPLMTVGVPIDLPQTKANSLNTENKPIIISVTLNGQIFLADKEVTLENMIKQVNEIATNGLNERIYLRADSNADYGTVMKVMGALSGAGYAKIGLITNQEQEQ